jgi:hypothetical protein
MCAHIASWKCENYACQHAHLKRPNGDTYECKMGYNEPTWLLKKGIVYPFFQKMFFHVNEF